MGLLDKMKQILFDEEEVEEEPKREKKVVSQKEEIKTRSGFVDHSSNLEDTITEIVIPKEEPKPEKKEEKAFNFTLDLDNYEPPREMRSKEQIQERIRESYYNNYQPKKEEKKEPAVYNKYAIEKKPEVKYQGKDYKSLINTPSRKEKKPFSVTPVISPVYGIIDEEYIKENGAKIMEERKEEKKEEIFGPVSYIEDILPKKHLKEESPELTTDEIEVKEVVREIATPNYDDYEEIQTSGIENNYIGNNIEEAFDKTSDIDTVNYEVENNVTEEEKHENDALADTIETDLFNLIDSMYKDDEEE